MEEEELQKIFSTACDYHKSGYNCAESILHTYRDRLPFVLSDDAMRIATCFGGGGIGGSGFCGALSGAVMALSLLVGRPNLETSREPAHAYAREFGDRFVACFSANTCKALQIYEYGSPEQKTNCRRITGTAARLLAEYLDEKNLLPAARQAPSGEGSR